MKSRSAYLRPALILLAALLILAIGDLAWQSMRPPQFFGGVIDPPKPMPDFTLQAVSGPAHLSDYRGKIVALAFGYTSCPDICPAVLADLQQALKKLDTQDAAQVQVIFVSVDYKRDGPSQAAAFAQNFNPGFLGLGGSQAQIDQATSDFGIYYKLNEPDAKGAYSVDHTAVVMLIDRQGRMVMTWPFDMEVEKMASDLRTLVRQSQPSGLAPRLPGRARAE